MSKPVGPLEQQRRPAARRLRDAVGHRGDLEIGAHRLPDHAPARVRSSRARDEVVQVLEHESRARSAPRSGRSPLSPACISSVIAAARAPVRAGRRRRRPAGARLSRTRAATKSTSSRRSGSSCCTGIWPPSIDGRCAVPPHQPPPLDLLRRVVDGDIGVGLEEADLADAIPADAAGRDVRDAARREPQARVGDVELRRQHRHADRFDRRRSPIAPAPG